MNPLRAILGYLAFSALILAALGIFVYGLVAFGWPLVIAIKLAWRAFNT